MYCGIWNALLMDEEYTFYGNITRETKNTEQIFTVKTACVPVNDQHHSIQESLSLCQWVHVMNEWY